MGGLIIVASDIGPGWVGGWVAGLLPVSVELVMLGMCHRSQDSSPRISNSKINKPHHKHSGDPCIFCTHFVSLAEMCFTGCHCNCCSLM